MWTSQIKKIIDKTSLCSSSSSALNMTLPAFCTERGRPQLSIDICCRRTSLLLSIDGTNGRTPDRYIAPAPHFMLAASKRRNNNNSPTISNAP